jgi:benzoylformate decarboxylase
MRGRQVFMDSLVTHGVECIFGNPGTTESPIIDSLLDYPQLRYIVALHEGIAVGAANHYAQATGKTGVVNVHVAPGLGNTLGMLYDALKAGTPLLLTAGQQDTRLRLRDPLLGYDLVSMAAPLTKWAVQAERADELALVLHRAFKIANDAPAGPVFVALPIDVLAHETDQGAIAPGRLHRSVVPDPTGIAEVTALLLESTSPAIMAGDDVARAGARDELIALAELVGAAVWSEGIRFQLPFPTGHPNFRGAVPFEATAIRKTFESADVVLLVGGPFFEEVWYSPGALFPVTAKVVHIEQSPARLAYNFAPQVGLVAHPCHALRAIRAAVEAGMGAAQRAGAQRRSETLRGLKDGEAAAQKSRAEKRWRSEPITMPRAMADLRAALPADAIVVDEAITAGPDLARSLPFERPGDYYGGRGGGIGQALPGALGVKVAHPDRPVVAVSGDGSAMYSIQALWTAAHHELGVVFVILANREYRILKHNMDAYRQRFGEKPDRPYLHMDLTKPELGFVEMAQGMGVAGTRVTRADDFRPALEAAIRSGRPHLIELLIEGRA